MTQYEVLTIVVSAIAIVLSLVTLHFTFFHKKTSMLGVVASFVCPDENNASFATFEVVLANTGNRDLLVREVEMTFDPYIDDLVPELECRKLPVVLSGGSMIHVQVHISSLFLHNTARKSRTLQMRFHVITPEGDSFYPHKMLTPIGAEPSFASDLWIPFALGAKNA